MAGRTLLCKWNTGPSGHGLPAAAGEALALKRAGAGAVKVFAIEGEGGLTPGAGHEAKNAAWGLGLDNLVLLVDWTTSASTRGQPRALSQGHRSTGSPLTAGE
jgi:transketolase